MSKIMLAAGTENRALFIKLRASGITPAAALVDRLRLTAFGKGKTAYLRLDDALAWFERRQPLDPAIATYRRVLTEFKAELAERAARP
jgi:hypothetical protein